MIETDRYKEHAEGEWIIYINETCDECQIIAPDYGTIAQTFCLDYDKQFLATTKLIADAPKLLAEIKRLREVLKDIHYDLTFKGTPEEMNSKALSTLSEVMYVD